MIIFGGPSYFRLSSSYAYVVLLVAVLVHMQGLDLHVVGFLVVDCLAAGL